MPLHIDYRNGVYWIENPVIPEENFAEKWNQEPSKRVAFYHWLKIIRRDIIENPLKCFGIDEISDCLSNSLGKAPVNRAVRKLGNEILFNRKSGNLYINGLTGGLSAISTTKSKLVKEHTFFGS